MARFHFGLSKTELGQRRARLPASPPAEKATARRQDQAGQSSADDGAGNRAHAVTDIRDSVVETKPYRLQQVLIVSVNSKFDVVSTSQQWDADQVV